MSEHKYDLVIFDLDGTLVDSRLDLANSVNFTRVQLGLLPLENERICTFVGDGAPILLRRALGPTYNDQEIHEAVQVFLRHYRMHLLDHTILYPGVVETLRGLEKVTLAVLTNKPVAPSMTILQGLGIHHHFKYVYGGDSFERKKPDPAGALEILKETGVPGEKSLMVGDSRNDVLTGRNAGIATCGVTYGLAPDQLKDPDPDFRLDDIRGLISIVYPSESHYPKGGQH